MSRIIKSALLTAVALSLLTGCKASPGELSSFIDKNIEMKNNPDIPFQHFWLGNTFDLNDYNMIIVVPVNTAHLAKATWWDHVSLAWDRKKDTRKIAKYFQRAVQKALKTKDNNRFNQPGSKRRKIMTLEIALVELSPTKASLNAAGLLVGLVVDHGMVAFEARLTDAATRKLIAAFADREQGKTALLTVHDYTWFGHAEEVIDDWAKQIVEVTNNNFNTPVKDSPTLTLDLW